MTNKPTPIVPPAWTWPSCEAVLRPVWYRVPGQRCSLRGAWRMPDGRVLCNRHAEVAKKKEVP